MSATLESDARHLLVQAFPQHSEFFSSASYRGSVPEYRLLGRDASGVLRAHIECGTRVALVNGEPVNILGIGAVAIHPSYQGQGVGREMFTHLREVACKDKIADFGFLECREEVADFYRRAGFERLTQPCKSMHHETGEWETYHGPVMAMPLLRSMDEWPRDGIVDLQGMSW